MCWTVQVVWHVKHCGCGSCFSMKAWVSLEWPMRSRDITTRSLLDALKASLHSPKVGWIWKSLLLMFMSHRCWHFLWRNLLIIGFKSVYEMEIALGLRSKADLAVVWFGFNWLILCYNFVGSVDLSNISKALLTFNDPPPPISCY